MSHQIRKTWVKKSPCSGCWCLDSDGMPVEDEEGGYISAEIEYCSSVTDLDRFYESRYGKKFGKQRLYRNCPYSNHGEGS